VPLVLPVPEVELVSLGGVVPELVPLVDPLPLVVPEVEP
jgi:hypothetical protein